MTDIPGPTFYAVLWNDRPQAEPIYLGSDIEKAALANKPGTCHGSGNTEHRAVMAAKQARMRIAGEMK